MRLSPATSARRRDSRRARSSHRGSCGLNETRMVSSGLGIAASGGGILLAAFLGDAFQVAALTKRLQWILGQIFGSAPFVDGRADIRGKRRFEALLGINEVAASLVTRQRRMVHQRGFREQLLRSFNRLDHRLDLPL